MPCATENGAYGRDQLHGLPDHPWPIGTARRSAQLLADEVWRPAIRWLNLHGAVSLALFRLQWATFQGRARFAKAPIPSAPTPAPRSIPPMPAHTSTADQPHIHRPQGHARLVRKRLTRPQALHQWLCGATHHHSHTHPACRIQALGLPRHPSSPAGSSPRPARATQLQQLHASISTSPSAHPAPARYCCSCSLPPHRPTEPLLLPSHLNPPRHTPRPPPTPAAS